MIKRSDNIIMIMAIAMIMAERSDNNNHDYSRAE